MKILFITANPYLPEAYGGLQISTHYLCRTLMERGHRVAVLANVVGNGLLGMKYRLRIKANATLFRHRSQRDMTMGYPVWRSWLPWDVVENVAARERPDLIVVLAVRPVRMALAARPTGIPILIQLQDVEFRQHDGDFSELGNVACVANSQFTARKYRDAYGVEPCVIYPFISLDRRKTETTRQNVVFVNPVRVKGRDIVLNVARLCPEIRFEFVENWPLPETERQELRLQLSSLPNVALIGRQKDMRKVYGNCKILLVPSVWEEGYGMVATEAQSCGIPVVGSTRGGLPEAIGPGGLLMDPDGPVEDWAEAVRKLWVDDRLYAALSVAAEAYAQRLEMTPAYQIDAYETIFRSVARG